ncbi:hypothetical protein WJX79_003364 [Trebouxia sp. C0005]
MDCGVTYRSRAPFDLTGRRAGMPWGSVHIWLPLRFLCRCNVCKGREIRPDRTCRNHESKYGKWDGTMLPETVGASDQNERQRYWSDGSSDGSDKDSDTEFPEQNDTPRLALALITDGMRRELSKPSPKLLSVLRARGKPYQLKTLHQELINHRDSIIHSLENNAESTSYVQYQRTAKGRKHIKDIKKAVVDENAAGVFGKVFKDYKPLLDDYVKGDVSEALKSRNKHRKRADKKALKDLPEKALDELTDADAEEEGAAAISDTDAEASATEQCKDDKQTKQVCKNCANTHVTKMSKRIKKKTQTKLELEAEEDSHGASGSKTDASNHSSCSADEPAAQVKGSKALKSKDIPKQSRADRQAAAAEAAQASAITSKKKDNHSKERLPAKGEACHARKRFKDKG